MTSLAASRASLLRLSRTTLNPPLCHLSALRGSARRRSPTRGSWLASATNARATIRPIAMMPKSISFATTSGNSLSRIRDCPDYQGLWSCWLLAAPIPRETIPVPWHRNAASGSASAQSTFIPPITETASPHPLDT